MNWLVRSYWLNKEANKVTCTTLCCQSFFPWKRKFFDLLAPPHWVCTLAFLPQLQPPIDHNSTSTLSTQKQMYVHLTKYSIKFWNILPFLELCPSFIHTFKISLFLFQRLMWCVAWLVRMGGEGTRDSQIDSIGATNELKQTALRD